MGREGLAPRGIWGWVQGVGLVQGVARSGLVCYTPSARSADAREARFLVEFGIITGNTFWRPEAYALHTHIK